MSKKTKAVLFNTKHIGDFIISLGYDRTSDITRYQSQTITENVFRFIEDKIKDGAEVNIAGFGKFYTMDVKEKLVRNPKTGETSTLPAHKKVKFKPGLRLKERINKN